MAITLQRPYLIVPYIAIFLFLISNTVAAQETFCTGLLAATPLEPSGILKIGRIVGNELVQPAFGPLEARERTVTNSNMTSGRSVRPGSSVAVGQAISGFLCIYYANGSEEISGWVPSTQVQLRDPESLSTTSTDWLGTWRGVTESATIKLEANYDTIHAEGDAAYANADQPINFGHFEAQAVPRSRRLTLVEPRYSDCRLTLLLLSRQLVVVDNGECGGMNVRFSGFYVSDKH